MLKEMRQDPMLAKFKKILLQSRRGGKTGYSETTTKSYVWQSSRFLDYCREHDRTPKGLPMYLLKEYLNLLADEVTVGKFSYSFFLQACTSMEILYRTISKDKKKADAIPRIREDILRKYGERLRQPALHLVATADPPEAPKKERRATKYA